MTSARETRGPHGRLWARARSVYDTLGTAARDWLRHRADVQAAAISFYTIFSLAPLLVIVVAVTGWIVGRQRVREEILEYFRLYIGEGAARYAENIIENAARPRESVAATIISIAVMVIAASGAFGQLNEALDNVWEVRTRRGGMLWRLVRTRLSSFAIVLCLGLLVIASLAMSTALAALTARAEPFLPGAVDVLRWLDLGASFLVLTFLFALIYRVLPDAQIGWREVWAGAFITAVLFSIGRFLIGFYFARSAAASVYGAAGSLAIILMWVFYSAMIFLYGAELTHVSFQRLGKRPEAKDHAHVAPGAHRRAEARAREAARVEAGHDPAPPAEPTRPADPGTPSPT